MIDRQKLRSLPRWIACSSSAAAALLVATSSFTNGTFAASTEFAAEPSWDSPSAATVARQLDDYLHAAKVTPDRQALVRDMWRAEVSDEAPLLDRLATCLAVTDDRVATLVAFCSQPSYFGKLPDFSWLANSETSPFVRFNMRLYYARWLAQNSFDDEALAWTDGLSTADVVAPDMLLFYRAVASQRTVQADRADATLAELMERSDDLPVRYQKLAALMQQDLTDLEDDSLDHIARRMADVRRRLTLGRAGKTVQVVETGVVESLDKLIKKLEDQAQQQSQSAAAAAGGQPSSTPMPDSRLAELKAPGKVEPRDIGHGADWGDMPDKDREQALQEIGREYPSHYREVIEEYFRKMAAEESDDKP